MVAVFLCCEYIVGLLVLFLSVSLSVCDFSINLRAARDECELNMLLEKMAFSYARKRVSRSKVGGMVCKSRVKICGSYF